MERAIPDFSGTWEMKSSENFEELLKKLGRLIKYICEFLNVGECGSLAHVFFCGRVVSNEAFISVHNEIRCDSLCRLKLPQHNYRSNLHPRLMDDHPLDRIGGGSLSF